MRLTEMGYEMGLISEERYQKYCKKKEAIEKEIKRLEAIYVGAGERTQEVLLSHGSTPLQTSATLAELIRRPELNYEAVRNLDPEREDLPKDVCDQVNINIKYEGYIRRQAQQVRQFKKLENKKIPVDIDYQKVNSLRIEAVQKLEAVRPASIGQASRISGVSPADITVLMVYLETLRGGKS